MGCCPVSEIIISIYALRVEGDNLISLCEACHNISIHALRVEGDWLQGVFKTDWTISIHALRVEGDPYIF